MYTKCDRQNLCVCRTVPCRVVPHPSPDPLCLCCVSVVPATVVCPCVVDADNDGVPDVQQVSPTDLLTRKTLLFLKVLDL